MYSHCLPKSTAAYGFSKFSQSWMLDKIFLPKPPCAGRRWGLPMRDYILCSHARMLGLAETHACSHSLCLSSHTYRQSHTLKWGGPRLIWMGCDRGRLDPAGSSMSLIINCVQQVERTVTLPVYHPRHASPLLTFTFFLSRLFHLTCIVVTLMSTLPLWVSPVPVFRTKPAL